MEDKFPFVLFVEGKWDPTTPKLKNKLNIYFQSKRSHGGDCEVEHEVPDGQTARVRFRAEGVRQNVLGKRCHEIKMDEDVLSLRVYLPPAEAKLSQETKSSVKTVKSPATDEKPPSSKSETEEAKGPEPSEDGEDSSRTLVVIKNIQELKKEFLSMLVENVLKCYLEDENFTIEVVPEHGCAVVTFTNNKDAEHFIQSCPNNSVFKKKNLEVSPLEMTRKLKIEDFSSDINSDYILLYFEKYGEVEVEMLEDNESALITFKTHADVIAVLAKAHYIKKLLIKVYPYYESLGFALYGKERPSLKLPESFMQNVDPSVWKYFQEHQNPLVIIKLHLQNYFCHLEFKDPAVKVSPLSSILQQGVKTKKLLQTWREKASAEFNATMSQYKSLEITIERDAWAELEAEVRTMLLLEPVTLILHEGHGTMIVAGLAEDVHRIGNVVQSTVSKITQRIQRVKNSIEDQMPMTPSIYAIIMKDGLQNRICCTFLELMLDYDANGQKLTFSGLKQDILESKNMIYQAFADLNRRMIALDAPVLQFLIKGDIEKLTEDLFLSKGILASMDIQKGQAFIAAKTEKALKDGEAELKMQLDHARLDVEDPSMLLSTEWKVLVDQLNDTVNSQIMTMLINQSDRQVMISGFAASVLLVHDAMNTYIQNNNRVTTTLQAEKIVVNFIKEHKKEDWCQIGRNNVKVSFDEAEVSLCGPRLQVSNCKVVFENLLSSVSCCRFKVDKPGAGKLFKNKEMFIVETAKNKMGCVVELVEEHARQQAASSIIGKKRVHKSDAVEIIVGNGDMCVYQVDAVVNSANGKLNLDAGLSKALSDAAGPRLQEACKQIIKKQTQLYAGEAVITEAGQLPCTHVIHAVGPKYNGWDPQKAVSVLKNAVRTSLELAEREYCQSLAIPALSSGSLGFPPRLCADTIVSALNEFFQLNKKDRFLKEVHLIDKNEKTIEAFEAAVQKTFGGSSKKQDPTFINSSGSQQTNPKPPSFSNQGSSQSVKTNEGLTITLAKCNIQDTSLDVVVNSITADLALNHGAIAQAILDAAGPQIQTLLNQQPTGPVNTGAIFVTNGCNLKNKLVFHAVAPHWNQGQGSPQSHLESLVDGCLNLAEEHKQGSIVLPAIGTGKLGFPKTLVPSIILDSILKFSKNRASHHVQEVMIAVYPGDQTTIQLFTDEFSKKFQVQSSLASGSIKGPFSKVTTAKAGIYETSVGGVVLQVLSGDIVNETTDVIVNSTNSNFTLKLGVSKAVLDKAGPNVEVECQRLGALPNDGLIITQQGNLKCKKIIHVSAKNDLKTIQNLVKQSLDVCAEKKFTSVSFPAFGTGQGGVYSGYVADHMLDGIIDFLTQTPQSSLQTVRLVIFQASMLVDFHQSMVRREATYEQKTGGTWSRLSAFTKSLFMSSKPQNVMPQQEADFLFKNEMAPAVCFSICGPSQSAVNETKQFLDKVISEEQAFQVIDDSMILKLSDKDRQRIQELQKTMDVNLKPEHKGQVAAAADSNKVTLRVEGLSKDVLMVSGEINAMLKATRDKANLKKSMEITAELVNWQYQQGGQFHSFDLATNFQLEKAFNQNSQQVDINFQNQGYKVRMPEGPAVSASGDNQMEIRRVDKIRASDGLPEEWEDMASNELHKVCPLQTNSKEYTDVLGHFRKSCQLSVLKIERVQNYRMWKNYQNNKQFMEQKNGHQNNEKLLFHGTVEESVSQINQNGFNRSYAGKNAAAFGRGTYFALNAVYSAQDKYSVPNAQGMKRMYFCRVLTGDYVLGNQAMIDAPAKSANGIDLYDSVVDNTATPTIFVVFRDYHAYPDYLITFI